MARELYGEPSASVWLCDPRARLSDLLSRLRYYTCAPLARYTCRMRQVNRTALVGYTPAQMFALVDDIERYPDFVPWVTQVEVLQRQDSEVTARLEMERAGVRERFTTRNTLHHPNRIDLQLVDGPFKLLEGQWTFEAIQNRGTKIGLLIRFEFANPVTALLLSRSFEKSCAQLVDAFTQRARAVYVK